MLSNTIINENQTKIKSDIERLELFSDQYPFSLSMRIKNFEDEKGFIKFIKNCEKNIRGSLEYRYWRQYLVDVLNINKCSFTNEEMVETSVEIHHHVPSLYMIIKSIITKNMEEKEEFSTFDICLRVMEIHYRNEIGYVPLISNLHEKFHNNFLQIPIEFVHGNYKAFIAQYFKYLDDTDLETINSRINTKLADIKESYWKRDEYPGIING